MGHSIRDDNHVRCAEAVRGVFRNVHPLLHRKQGCPALTLCFLDLLNDEGHIVFHGLHEVIGVVVGHRAFGAQVQVLFNQVFCQSVSSRTLCGVLTLLILELLSQHQRGRAVQSAVQGRRRVSCVGPHQRTLASAIKAG